MNFRRSTSLELTSESIRSVSVEVAFLLAVEMFMGLVTLGRLKYMQLSLYYTNIVRLSLGWLLKSLKYKNSMYLSNNMFFEP